ncbi:hypothetical protein NDU88_003954 [Pleurodeles waltl]|uniref:Uncharacterized protein n=1 Tax=Pleurodeles waltl TaxID=8319 RepID=A0AAV7WTY4_PLEWA|nr:hypothetical protein NDU88_003954 [Pleurodeles waltl]
MIGQLKAFKVQETSLLQTVSVMKVHYCLLKTVSAIRTVASARGSIFLRPQGFLFTTAPPSGTRNNFLETSRETAADKRRNTLCGSAVRHRKMPPSPKVPHTLQLCGRRLCGSAVSCRKMPPSLKVPHTLRLCGKTAPLACSTEAPSPKEPEPQRPRNRRSDLRTCCQSSPQLLNKDSGTR